MPLPYRIVLSQIAVGLVFACLVGAWSPEDGKGALLGVVSLGIPKAWFAWRAEAAKSGGALLVSGVTRFCLEAVLVAVVIWRLEPPPVGFLGAIVIIQISQLFGGIYKDK